MKITDWDATDSAYIKDLTENDLCANWEQLHLADAEPLPEGELLKAWLLFHQGHYEQAAISALELGNQALPVLMRSVVAYTDYVEEDEDVSTDLLQQAYSHAEDALSNEHSTNAAFTTALCMGRYAQQLSIVKALKEGLGNKVKNLLAKSLGDNPNHAEAHIAMAMYHAEIIDKVGSMIGGLTYGACADTARDHLEKGLALAPSAINLIEAGNAYLLLDGEKKGMKKATALYQQAAECDALDCLQSMDVDFAADQIA
ncbi:hypothetical protein [Marinicella rhabdoformis]|uniref:hypothetical protein n=1 Tax=Marinicella rhabdoformis TaxID=2580566 RepID=UPI0012AED141|nr:hypothetical protein [Marinicella rhabdoformis]